MPRKKDTPEQMAARCLKWLASPAGKRALAKAKRNGDRTREMFKQRPFTAEELNTRYRSPLEAHEKP